MASKGVSGTEPDKFAVALDLSKPLPGEIDLGARFEIIVAVEAESELDLTGATFNVIDGETIVATGAFPVWLA